MPPTAAVANAPPLAHELVKGAHIEDSSPRSQHPPTCLLVHGILGSRRNLLSFAKRLATAFPNWQFLLVDLRCHGQSTPQPPAGPNTVEAAALDVIALLNHLKIYPVMLMGHSFGGKVVMSMVHQSGKVMPRPVQVWVLDTVPGDVWVSDGGDHPRDTITHVSTLEPPFDSRRQLVDSLTGAGFSLEGAQWMATNLKPLPSGQLDWTFDIKGIAQLYSSYEECDLWPMLATQPKGLQVDFVRAERSAFVWTEADVAKISGYGARVNLLADSSHWVHIDNPFGLLDIVAPSFERMARQR